MHSAIYALFHDVPRGREAIDQLIQQGLSPQRLSVAVSQPAYDAAVTDDDQSRPAEQTADGVGAGAIFGIAIGQLAVVGTGEPESSSVGILAAGPMVTALALAQDDDTSGQFVGGMQRFGVPGEQAQYIQQHLEDGGVLVAVKVDSKGQTEQVRSMLKAQEPLQVITG